ncbi:MAG: Gfo/Idh/MocA family protein [Candidatus Dormibacteraceae bacterium]
MAGKVRVGLIGCGGIGQRHAAALSSIDAVDFAACCDVDERKAQKTAATFGVSRSFGDAASLFRSGAVDAVTICTPHPQHGPVLIAAADAGVNAIVEKPLSIDLGEADRMVEAADRAGITFATIFQRRWFPAAQRIREAIDSGRLGRLTMGECFARLSRDRAYFARDAWRGQWDTEGGGSLMNQAVHMIDLIQWYLGPVDEVYGRWATLKHGDYIEVEDTAVATLAFRSGALGVIEATTTYDPPFGFQIAVHGTSGATVGLLERPEGSQAITDVWTFAGEEARRAGWETEEAGRPGFPEFHRLQLQDFVTSILERRPPAVTGVEGRKSLEIINAIYASNRTHRPKRPSDR